MHDSAKVSVIIPVHNREDVLARTLESVISQDFTSWECIIVDDHSTDGSAAVAEAYAGKDIRFLVTRLSDAKRYANAARNVGLSLAKGEFVNFLDSDDLFLPNKLQLQLNEFACDPTLEVVTCQHAIVGERGLYYPKFALDECWLDVVWYPDYKKRYGGLWGTSAPLWRRKSIQAIGGWDERLRIWQDVELNIRAMTAGLRIRRVEQVLVHVSVISTDRVSSPSPEKFAYQQESILIAWELLESKNQVTDLRRRMAALKLLFIARQLIRGNQLSKGLYFWVSGSFSIHLNVIHTLDGIVQLLGVRYRLLQPAAKSLRPTLFGHLNHLPDGILSSELGKGQSGIHYESL